MSFSCITVHVEILNSCNTLEYLAFFKKLEQVSSQEFVDLMFYVTYQYLSCWCWRILSHITYVWEHFLFFVLDRARRLPIPIYGSIHPK